MSPASYTASALLKVQLNCDQITAHFASTLSLARFEYTSYVTHLPENAPRHTNLTVDFLIMYASLPQTTLKFYFCNSTSASSTFKIHESTGRVSLDVDSALDRESQDVYVYDVCVRLVHSSINQSLATLSTRLFIHVDDLNDNAPRLLTFSESVVRLRLPLDFVRRQLAESGGFKRLLRLSAFDADVGLNGRYLFLASYSSQSTSRLFNLNASNGWLSLRRVPSSPSPWMEPYRMRLSVRDLGGERRGTGLNSRTVTLLVSFVQDVNACTELEASVVASPGLRQSVFNLRHHFAYMYRYLAVVEKHGHLVSYDQESGNVSLSVPLDSKNLTGSLLVLVKLVSEESELSVATLRLHLLIKSESPEGAKAKEAVFNVWLSMRSKIGTVVFRHKHALDFNDDDDDVLSSLYASVFEVFDVRDKESEVRTRIVLDVMAPHIEKVTFFFREKPLSSRIHFLIHIL